jgi:hypothetical protein
MRINTNKHSSYFLFDPSMCNNNILLGTVLGNLVPELLILIKTEKIYSN